ncbi:MAG: PqqD family peptide modification chaperone [bacterium]
MQDSFGKSSGLHPKWNRQWEKTSDGLAVILIPKFGNHLVGKWLMARMQKPHYRLKLDEIGTFVWEQCDGGKSIQDIGDRLKKQFGDRVEPVQDRLKLFFKSLEKNKSVTWVTSARLNGQQASASYKKTNKAGDVFA